VFPCQRKCFTFSLGRHIITQPLIRHYSFDGVRIYAGRRRRTLNRSNVFVSSQLIECEPYVWCVVCWSRRVRFGINIVHYSCVLSRGLSLVASDLLWIESHKEGLAGVFNFIGAVVLTVISWTKSLEAAMALLSALGWSSW